jgi:hypothetical protein
MCQVQHEPCSRQSHKDSSSSDFGLVVPGAVLWTSEGAEDIQLKVTLITLGPLASTGETLHEGSNEIERQKIAGG